MPSSADAPRSSLRVPTDPEQIVAVAVSIVAGIFIATMVRLNATLGEHVGPLESSFVVHAVGTAFATLLILPRMGVERLRSMRSTPLKLFIGGVLGVTLVMVANIVVPILGVALTLCVSVAANLAFSTVADHFGLFGLPVFPVSARRILGLVLVVAGVVLVAYG
jgi:transporter family-2 protein